MITLESGDFGWDYLIRDLETDETVYVQSDQDWCGIARTFGWTPCRRCNNTDGTVDCAHLKASVMHERAGRFLERIADSGKRVEDPGYFGGAA